MPAYSTPKALGELATFLRCLPGVGKRSAERMALAVYQWNDDRLNSLANLLSELHSRIHPCPCCGNLSDAPDSGLCPICASPTRDHSCICVVEDFTQIFPLESAGMYQGLYHVLGGRIAPLDGLTADKLAIPSLIARLEAGGVSEIILALSQDLEGQATSVYLAECLAQFNVRVSRLASGLPAGADLSYADSATIAVALAGRTDLNI